MDELMKVIKSWIHMVAEGLCTEEEASLKIEDAIITSGLFAALTGDK